MADLTSGRYANQSPLWGLFGNQVNAAQGDVPAIHNASPGVGVEDGAPMVTKKLTLVPVPCPEGVEISTVKIFGGATESETATHAWAAIYSGVAIKEEELKAVLQAQSKDNTTYEMKKTETVTFTLEKPVLVTNAVAPNGYIYVGVYLVGTKVGTYAAMKSPAKALFKAVSGKKVFPWFTNGPISTVSKITEGGTAPKEAPVESELAYAEPVPLLLLQ